MNDDRIVAECDRIVPNYGSLDEKDGSKVVKDDRILAKCDRIVVQDGIAVGKDDRIVGQFDRIVVFGVSKVGKCVGNGLFCERQGDFETMRLWECEMMRFLGEKFLLRSSQRNAEKTLKNPTYACENFALSALSAFFAVNLFYPSKKYLTFIHFCRKITAVI